MSTLVMSRCWDLQMPPTQKSVLISLADNANDHGACWPSIPTICRRTCFSERAVQNAIKWLEGAGLLTADRTNGRHTSYTVTPAAYSPPQEIHPRTKCTGEGDAPAQAMHHTPVADAGAPPQEMHQPPHQVPSNRQEPSVEPSGNRHKSRKRANVRVALPDWLSGEAWNNWADYRLSKASFTQRAAELSIEKLASLRADGHDPVAVIDQSILRGWSGLFPVKTPGLATTVDAPGIASSSWWQSVGGVHARGDELGLTHREDKGELYRQFRVRVLKAAGPGPWRDEYLKEIARETAEYERTLAYFGDEEEVAA